MTSPKVVQSLSASLTSLRSEYRAIGDAIAQIESTLTRLTAQAPPGATTGKRRGRPPKVRVMADAEPMRRKKTGRATKTRGWTPAQKKAAAERMRKYWADRKGKGG